MPIRPADLLRLGAMSAFLKPRRVFEFGTYVGCATLTLAMNTPDDCTIFTLDVVSASPNTHGGIKAEENAAAFPLGDLFRHTPFAKKICQLCGPSQDFDFRSFRQSMDFILIDADHRYECVRSDTQHAFEMLRPGGVIVWDDYDEQREDPTCVGVKQYLKEMSRQYPVVRLIGSRLALYVDAR